MILRLQLAAPSIFGWAVAAVCAFLGARFSGDLRITSGIWAAAAMLAMGASFTVFYRTRYRARRELDALEREIGDERAALGMGRRARWVLLTVADRDGTLYQQTLAQVLTDVTPEGRTMVWDEPAAALLYYAEPHEMGENDGRPK